MLFITGQVHYLYSLPSLMKAVFIWLYILFYVCRFHVKSRYCAVPYKLVGQCKPFELLYIDCPVSHNITPKHYYRMPIVFKAIAYSDIIHTSIWMTKVDFVSILTNKPLSHPSTTKTQGCNILLPNDYCFCGWICRSICIDHRELQRFRKHLQ